MITRKSPLKRTKWLVRQSQPIRRKGRPRFRGYVRDKAYTTWVRATGCVIHDSRCGPVWEVAHVRSRGAGGQDTGNIVCLCRQHHAEQHRIGARSFDRKYGISCRDIAVDLWTEYQEAW